MLKITKCYLVSVDIRPSTDPLHSGETSAVLLVAEKQPGKDAAIINSFSGEQAISLHATLTGIEFEKEKNHE